MLMTICCKVLLRLYIYVRDMALAKGLCAFVRIALALLRMTVRLSSITFQPMTYLDISFRASKYVGPLKYLDPPRPSW